MMHAAVVHEYGAPLVIEERPMPVAGTGEVVVKVEACGLCHTDLHAIQGSWPVKPPLPFVPGHEAVGLVTEIGPGVSHLHVGDRVVAAWLGWACGRCHYCMTGSEALCRERRNTGYDFDGGFAEYLKASADFVIKVPRSIDPLDAACLSCAGVSAYKAVKVSGARTSDITAVFGIGGVGHLTVQYARAAGASVVAVDTMHDKLKMARELGARHTVDCTTADPVKAIQALGGAAQAIVATGSAVAFDQALASLRPGGTLVLVALPPDGSLCLPVFDAVHNGITVVGSIGGNRADLIDVLSLHAEGYTHVIHQARGLSQVNQAIAELEADTVPARLVFEFR
jgi:alcohol dehydrogenase, propanol-preferring